ncbi:hypothetical protein [Nonomuraea basaltis]|uniref:hypothetical protein n=1 Tax=Nonomuraea basaltis TaxID=2495887 RepID=UPI00110C3F00|nr:hypothetical protein [Nonomuraea basaltis]TMR94892.1 hypothetical protein EJK15_31210 [Nonomuraea basaltis]
MLAVDNDDTYSSPKQVSVAADGTLWALYDKFSSDGVAVDRLRRWNGEAWQTFDVPPSPIMSTEQFYGESPVDIAMVVTSAQQVHVFNVVEYPRDSPLTVTLGTVVHTFNAGRWRSDILSGTHSTHVNDSWGDPVSADGSWVRLFGRVLRWDGSSWQLHTLTTPDPDFPTDGTAVFSDDEAEPWAVVSWAKVLRRESSGWREIGLPAPGLPSPREFPGYEITYTLEHIRDVVALDADDVWAVGEVGMSNEEHEGNGPIRSLALHWDGDSWSCHWGPKNDLSLEGAEPDLEHAEPDGAGGMWVTGHHQLRCPWCFMSRTELLHLSEGRWTREQLPVPDGCKAEVTALVQRPASQEVYAVGNIYSPDGGKETCRDFPAQRAAIWRTG